MPPLKPSLRWLIRSLSESQFYWSLALIERRDLIKRLAFGWPER